VRRTILDVPSSRGVPQLEGSIGSSGGKRNIVNRGVEESKKIPHEKNQGPRSLFPTRRQWVG